LGQFFLTQYQYDDANRLTQMTYPSGRVVNYQRDAIGRLIGTTTTDTQGTQTPLITSRNYRADGLWTEQVYGSGLTQTKNYDQQGRLTDHQVSNTGNTDEYSRQYTYDANGNILREQSLDNLYDTDYQYDALDRLTEELDSIKTLTRGFDYDANGNRLEESEDDNGSTQITPLTYTNQSNRIETINGQTISLDPSGRTLQDGEGRSFAYNDAGRIRSISMNGQVVGEYFYNSQQLRTRKIVGGEITLYHYDLVGNMIAESGFSEPVLPTNIALNKIAEQSSTAVGWTADRAVNGAFNDSTHTVNQNQPWWQVDLGSQSEIQTVRVHKRSDCCSVWLSDFYVLVSDAPFGSQSLDELLANPSVDKIFHVADISSNFTDFVFNGSGRYVRIQLTGSGLPVNLAEVEILNVEPSITEFNQEYIYSDGERVATFAHQESPSSQGGVSSDINISHGKQASQSSTAVGWTADRAVNGFFNDSTHTTNENQPWWQVDLDGQADIQSVRIHKRVDCCSVWLSDFYVLISDVPFGAHLLSTHLADPKVDKVFHAGEIIGDYVDINFTNANGRYVRVQLNGSGLPVNLAEVEVLGEMQTNNGAVNTKLQYYINDHLKTPQQLINEDNEITWEAEYEAFGEANIKTQQVTNNHRFPGQYYDQETGLHYNWNRYYDAGVGRYLTSDPIGLQGGINTFGYVGGNPLFWTDPSGLQMIMPGPIPMPIPPIYPTNPPRWKPGWPTPTWPGGGGPKWNDPSEMSPIKGFPEQPRQCPGGGEDCEETRKAAVALCKSRGAALGTACYILAYSVWLKCLFDNGLGGPDGGDF
ncbi:MAG: RHS repeat-associated core domain-containing protein, partial [Arenicella sp.]